MILKVKQLIEGQLEELKEIEVKRSYTAMEIDKLEDRDLYGFENVSKLQIANVSKKFGPFNKSKVN